MKSARDGVRRVGFLVGWILVATLVIGASAHASYQFVTEWGSRGSGDGRFVSPQGIAVDGAGNVYVADTWNHRIQKFDGSGAFLTKWGSEGTGDGQFSFPSSIAVGTSGNVYVADTDNHRIEKFDGSGTFLAAWGVEGSGDGEFRGPRGIAVDATGNVYVGERLNYRVQKFDGSGTFLTTWGSFGTGDGQFHFPEGVAVDAAGNVYVADAASDRIQKFDGNGTFVSKWGSRGSGDGQFYNPCGVAVDAAGNVYVTDVNLRVQKFDGNGAFLTKWGAQGTGRGEFGWVNALAVDFAGNVYVADTGNCRVQKFADLSPTALLLSWTGEPGYLNDGCDPDISEANTARPTFRVRVTDADGTEPKPVQVLLRRDGQQWRSYTLQPVPGTLTSAGRIYYLHLPEPLPPGRYKYRFRAKDETGFATGPATVWQFGPSTYSELSFSGEPGLEDGVRPNAGTADTTMFLWRVIYQDNDGDAPTYIHVRLWRDGTYYDTLRMVTLETAPDPIAGIAYSARRRLPAGEYAYEFRAADKDGRAHGPASQKLTGLTVTTAAPTALTGLTAVPTKAGAQVTFTLSTAAQVEARVLNVAGRPVATLCHNRECEAGTNTLRWSARSDSGLPAPTGTYVIEVSAKAADGNRSRALVTVRLQR
ncbi:MAG: hypothetical protein FJX75_22305 [Armatimonadetes bacterium]|nr:hypothetical protein [Armatimonadota bacterium]